MLEPKAGEKKNYNYKCRELTKLYFFRLLFFLLFSNLFSLLFFFVSPSIVLLPHASGSINAYGVTIAAAD